VGKCYSRVKQSDSLKERITMVNRLPTSDTCPKCREKMDKGYLRCKGSQAFPSWGWVEEKKPWTSRWCIAKAHKCQRCKHMIISTDIIE
jgi:hypothetical protein